MCFAEEEKAHFLGPTNHPQRTPNGPPTDPQRTPNGPQRTPTDPNGPQRTPTDPNGPQRTPTDMLRGNKDNYLLK